MSNITYFELESLGKDLNVSSKFLYWLSNSIYSHYKTIKIPKRNGGFRVLEIPDKKLKIAQRKISLLIERNSSISRYCKSYRVGLSTIDNALPHLKNRQVVKLDIKDFFKHIIYSQVKDCVFPASIYSEKNRILLSILVTNDGTLPQGSPCSPIISNIVLKEFDDIVGLWCEDRNIVYTRYCDDLTFSGDCFDYNKLISYVSMNLRKYGFFLNKRKTKVISDGQQKKITGIIVNEKLNVPKEYRKDIRKEMYYINKYGIDEHLKFMATKDSKKKYLVKMLGKINYILSINHTEEFKTYRLLILELLKH